MKNRDSERKLAILRSQARQLETSVENASYEGTGFLEEQYNRLRDNLVSLDPDASGYVPDFRHKGFVGALLIDSAELLEKVRVATHQMNAYLDAILPQMKNKVSIKRSKNKKEVDFPEEILRSLPKEVSKTIGGVLLNYQNDFTDFCFWGMRKALTDAIRIRFRKDQKENLLYDKSGNAYKLSRWIELAKQEKYISSSTAKSLKDQVRVFGDVASHDYMANLQKEEVPAIMTFLRMALSRMYYEDRELAQETSKKA